MIRLLGLGWEDAYHPRSKDRYVYNSSDLLDHFIKNVLPLAQKLKKPEESPTSFPTLPEIQQLGTMSDLAKEKENKSKEEYE